jgi:hypothetical protein
MGFVQEINCCLVLPQIQLPQSIVCHEHQRIIAKVIGAIFMMRAALLKTSEI